MASHRSITLVAASLLVALPAVAPALATANPLLSGYGGPGTGNQAILGSALLNGPPSSGGGGGGSSPAGGSATNGASPATSAPPAVGAATGASQPSAQSRRRAGEGRASRAARAPAHPPAAGANVQTARASAALEIPGSDVLYILLVGGALILTGILTRQLMRPPRSEGRGS